MKLVGLVHFMKTGSIMATNAIAFQVDTKIQLRGMGLFGSKLNHHTILSVWILKFTMMSTNVLLKKQRSTNQLGHLSQLNSSSPNHYS